MLELAIAPFQTKNSAQTATSKRCTKMIIQLARIKTLTPSMNELVRSSRGLKTLFTRSVRIMPKPWMTMVMATSRMPQNNSSREMT